MLEVDVDVSMMLNKAGSHLPGYLHLDTEKVCVLSLVSIIVCHFLIVQHMDSPSHAFVVGVLASEMCGVP